MENTASILGLVFLAITFLQSGYDKLFYWQDNLSWLKGHFLKTPIKNMVPFSLGLILFLELVSGILSIIGAFSLLLHSNRTFGFYASVLSVITFLFLLTGQRLAKDYDGARTIVIYLIPALMLTYWLN